jgi:hypothetical protein
LVMPRQKVAAAYKKQIAGRIQQIIREKAGSNTAFGKKLEASTKTDLSYSTVRKWLPEPSWWTWRANKRRWVPTTAARGRSQRRRNLDWEAVQIPNVETLRRFCDFTGASAEFILFGSDNPYFQQTRGTQDLELDLVVAALRGALGGAVEIPEIRLAELWLMPSRLVEFLVETLQSELIIWNRYLSEMDSLAQALTRIAIAEDSMHETQPTVASHLSTARKDLLALASRLVPKTQLVHGARLVSPQVAKRGSPREVKADKNTLFGYYDVVPKGAVSLGKTTP